jgi:transposase
MDTVGLITENTSLKDRVRNLEQENLRLAEQVRLLRALHFGTSSEKLTKEDTRQASLFNEAEDGAFDQEIEVPKKTRDIASHTRTVRTGAGRKPIDANLPREIKEYDISDEQRTCTCGCEKTCIGEDVSERACIVPAKVIVRREIRKKYVCRGCEGTENDEPGVITAEGRRHLIPGSIADESLLAWCINEKYEYACPFYRQTKRLSAIGIPIPRATLSTLVIKAATACRPLYEMLKETIRGGPVINADETTVQVLKEPGRKAQSKSYMWVFHGGEPEKTSTVFQYETGRSHEVPYEFLTDYTGVVQTDDLESYHAAVRKMRAQGNESIRHVLCWAHARRKFYDYWELSQSEDAKRILDLISDLFDLEKLRHNYSLKGFVKQRTSRATLIFDQLWKLLTELSSQVPPGMAFGKAIHYTLDNWEQLQAYLENPHLTPSNNAAENAIRPFVIGRKNWLFSATPRGAESSAILYSLVESAKLHKLSVYDYFYHVLRRLPYCSQPQDYEALLPFNLSQEHLHSQG